MNKQQQSLLMKKVAPFKNAKTKSSVGQLLNTFPPFFLLWFAAYECLTVSYWLSLVLSLAASGFVVRIFIIFHDCCHGSFFRSRKGNAFLGTISGIITLFPFEKWKHSHAIHHATSGNLNKRGTGDIWLMTVDEYLSSSFWGRLAYRFYRNPFVMFILGPIFLFLISNRLNKRGARRKERLNTYLTNVAIVLLYTLMCFVIGWKAFLLIQLPILMVAGAAGIWLFYVQHQFEDSYFEDETSWDYVKAAVDGSSYYKLPKVLQWLTGNIGFHHIHHLSPRVPNYHLEHVHNANPALQTVTTITIRSSLKSLRFRLWDEQNKAFVNFRDLKHLATRKNKQTSSPLTAAMKKRKMG